MKKILLTAINAKYIHSNLAVYSLKAYAQSCYEQQSEAQGEENQKTSLQECPQIEIAEYTINQQIDEILRDIYKKKPDMLCFSCYIWNINYVEELIREIAKVLPETEIWVGGPEVSYDAKHFLKRYPEVKGVMKGEGEETFAELVKAAGGSEAAKQPEAAQQSAVRDLTQVKGITYREADGTIYENPWREIMDLNKVPFVYQDMTNFANKIIYYESSRGCPFSCSYCLSSVDKKLRFRDAKLVKKELQFFIDHEVPQVKFVDRTFNCSHKHAMEIWKYIAEHDKGITNFHFEVSADLLNEEEIAFIQSMRPGLIQLEIGVQSTNPDTIKEIRRTMKFDKLAEIVKAIKKPGNIHQHLDLIAGLPYEDLESFKKSFDDVYELKPEQLQLGFLKVLKGSFMEENQKEYELVFTDKPPYEVLSTKWLPYQDVLLLKGVEEMVEVYYNTSQFIHTLAELEREYDSYFELFQNLAEYYEESSFDKVSHARAARYEILLGFAGKHFPEKAGKYRELLTYDYYLRENAKNRPAFAGEYKIEKDFLREFYETEAAEHKYLEGYDKFDKNQLRKMTHLESFENLGKTVLFDYMHRSPLTKEAATKIVKI